MRVDKGGGGNWTRLEYADELLPLSETNAVQDTLYGKFMRKASYPDGSESFITFYTDSLGADETGGDPTYAERSLAAEQFFSNIDLGYMVPAHYFDAVPDAVADETDAAYYLAVAAVDGEEVSVEHKPGTWNADTAGDRVVEDGVGGLHTQRASDERLSRVDREDYLDFAAATLLSGNSDMKGENVMITGDGGLVGIDLDHAGGDFTHHYETSENWPESHYERAIRLLRSNARIIGFDVWRDEIEQHAQQLAQRVTELGDGSLDGVGNSSFTDDAAYRYRDNIAKNIEAFHSGRFPE